MKRLLSKKNLLGSAGLSLIELIISMAILAIVTIAVGGAMYVTSRSYKQNSAEINVQEEAQVASNLICDWLVDAQEVLPADGSDTTLVIKHYEGNNLVVLKVFQSGSELKYEAKYDATGVIINSGVLATNVTGVNFNSKFDDSRNVRIAIDFDVNDRTYHSVTDSTSRNHDFIADATGVNKSRPIITFDIPPTRNSTDFDVFLEPGQNDNQGASFTFNATIYNYDPTNTTFVVEGPTGVVDVTCTIGPNGGTNVFPITCTTTDNAKVEGTYTFKAIKEIPDPNGGASTYLIDTKTLTVNVRRANECKFNIGGSHVEELGASNVVSGTHGLANATYQAVSVGLGSQTYPRVPGAAYDNGFVDASNVVYYYRFADGSDASAYVNAVEVTSGSPSVQVTLAQNLPNDLYVVAVSTHQGDMPNDASSYKCGTTGNNKLRNAPYNVADWSYYDSVGKDKTWDVFKISASNSSPEPFTIGGFNRGTESFRLGKMTVEFRNELITILQSRYPGFNPDDRSTQHGLKYYSTLYYRPVYDDGSYGSWQSYVVGCTESFQNILDYEMVKFTRQESSIFDLDKDYQVKLQLDVVDGSNILDLGIRNYSSGTFPKVVPYVLNLSNDRVTNRNFIFEANAYSQSNPYEYNNSQMTFYTYFTGFDPKSIKVGYTIEIGVPNTSGGYNWHQYNNSVDHESFGIQNDAFEEGTFYVGSNAISSVKLTDGETHNIGQAAQLQNYSLGNYNECIFPDPNVRIEKVVLNSANNLNPNYMYRICFKTYYDQNNISNRGTIGGSLGSISGGTPEHNWYDLTSADNIGYIYFQDAH